MINIPNYIREKIKQYNPELDVREGSVLRDFLINPLTSILEPYQTEHTQILNQMTLDDISSLTDDQMDAIAATFLIERQLGTKATGYIRFYYNSPKAVIIPKGFGIKVGTVTFKTVIDYSITKSQMESNISQYPYYVTADIQVIADAVTLLPDKKKNQALWQTQGPEPPRTATEQAGQTTRHQ